MAKKTLIVITGVKYEDKGRTVAIYKNGNKVSAVYYFDEVLSQDVMSKLMSADEKILLLDDAASRVFVFPKDAVSKDAIFGKVAGILNTKNFLYAIEERGKYFIVITANNIYASYGFDYVGSFEVLVGLGVLRKFRKSPAVVVQGKRKVYLFTHEAVNVYNKLSDVHAPADSLILYPYRDAGKNGEDLAGEALSALRKNVKGIASRPWMGMKVSVERSVPPQLAEWAYVVEFVNTGFGNTVQKRFKESGKELPREAKMLIKAVVIILLAPAVTFGTKFIPYSLPFQHVSTPQIPPSAVVTTTAQLEKFVYNKGNAYSLYFIEDSKDNRLGYFTSENNAVKFAKQNKNWKVVKVEYENGKETSSTVVYP